MFSGAAAFNGDVSKWEVGNVDDMRSMFAGAVAFNRDLSAWDVRSNRRMQGMFYGATAYQPEHLLGSQWDGIALPD
ncbi:MAG: BspA family leucine-rich repeat surface protein, partial [Actinomycetales bacterium]